MSIDIYKVEEQHLDDAVFLFNEYRVFFGKPSDLPLCKQVLAQRIEEETSQLFIALHNSAPAGFMQLSASFSSIALKPYWTLNDLFVLPHHQGKGIGRKLLETAEAFTRKTQFSAIVLTTAVENESAQRLYEGFGFKKISGFHTYSLNCD